MAGNLRKMNWKKQDFKKSLEVRGIKRVCASSIGHYFAIQDHDYTVKVYRTEDT
jgi:hypothetical protein